jgi:TolB-like protein
MLRLALFCSLLLLIASSAAIAAPPATQPAIEVAVSPFSAIGDSSAPTWIGTAVQQNLIADLGRLHFHPSESSAADGYVIRGSYQYSDQLIRFSGQLSEAKTGRVVGGLTATGALRDLFALEDNLSNQAIRQLRQLTADPVPAPVPAAPAVAEPPIVAPAVAYDDSALQYYVETNLPPSNSYSDQLNASSYRQMYQYNYSSYYCGYYSPYYWGGSFYSSGPIFPARASVGFGRIAYHGFTR